MAATEANGIAIRAEDVRRHYAMGHSTIRAVDGVTLDVRRGEFVALLGSTAAALSGMQLRAGCWPYAKIISIGA